MGRLEDLRAMKPSGQGSEGAFTEPEGYEIIRKLRSGVRGVNVEETLGIARGTLWAKLGSWAVRYVPLPEEEEAARE